MDYIYMYQNYIAVVVLSIVVFFFGRNESIGGTIANIFKPIEIIFNFLVDAHRGRDGKPSHDRIMGSIVILNIIRLALLEKTVPEALMTMFWVLIGYSAVSKILAENPTIMEFIKLKYGITPKEEVKS